MRALAEKQDVRALLNHDPNFVLGRTKAGTLTLREDARGLHYTNDLPDTQTGRDLMTSIKRGDITGSSFAFVVKQDKWTQADTGDIREILDVNLFDVSPVTYPANEATSVGMRSLSVLMGDDRAAEEAIEEARRALGRVPVLTRNDNYWRCINQRRRLSLLAR